MRVVFDTNILVAAIVFPQGRAASAVMRVLEGRDELVISREIVGEVLGVLGRKFSSDREELSRVAVFLHDVGRVVRPRRRIDVLEDEPDNRILECAATGKADAIVTGDKAMLKLGTFERVNVISLNDYLEARDD